MSAYRWAERTGLIQTSPLRHLRKPPRASRGARALINTSDHARLCKAAGPAFRPFLQLLWLTGARPGELAGLTASDLDLAKGLAVLSDHKTAHLGKGRVLFLCPEAVAILRKMVVSRPSGLLFPGHEGATEKMTPQAITNRVQRVSKRAGVKCFAYQYRHTFATEALARGVPDTQVAALLGHASTAMLHRHYAHLGEKARVLQDALKKIRQ
jgi:integrase